MVTTGGMRVNLVPIGRFSKMTRLSVKALRLYDEIGLIKPASVDASSGYRYYSMAQANRAEAVRILRSVDMPLDEIQAVLAADNPELVHKQLVAHKERLAEKLAAQERMLAYLETLIQREGGIMPYDVTIIEEKPRPIAATMVKTNLSRISDDIGAGFGSLMQAMGSAGLAPTGAPLIIYHTVIDEETDGEIEICIPIEGTIPEGGPVYSRELEGGPMASTVHQGPYHEIAPAYHTITGMRSPGRPARST